MCLEAKSQWICRHRPQGRSRSSSPFTTPPRACVSDRMTTPFSTRRYAIALQIRVFVKARARNTARIGGVSLIQARGNTPERQAAACTLINWLISPEVAVNRDVSPATFRRARLHTINFDQVAFIVLLILGVVAAID